MSNGSVMPEFFGLKLKGLVVFGPPCPCDPTHHHKQAEAEAGNTLSKAEGGLHYLKSRRWKMAAARTSRTAVQANP